jgi:hypothetical protein
MGNEVFLYRPARFAQVRVAEEKFSSSKIQWMFSYLTAATWVLLSGHGQVFLGVFRFPLPIAISPISLPLWQALTLGLPVGGSSAEWTQCDSSPPIKIFFWWQTRRERIISIMPAHFEKPLIVCGWMDT